MLHFNAIFPEERDDLFIFGAIIGVKFLHLDVTLSLHEHDELFEVFGSIVFAFQQVHSGVAAEIINNDHVIFSTAKRCWLNFPTSISVHQFQYGGGTMCSTLRKRDRRHLSM